MRAVLNWCLRHLFAYREQAQKWILGCMFFGVVTLSACPVCFCDEFGWPDHITVTYNASSTEPKTVEILCTPLKETRCGAWHDSNNGNNHDNSSNSSHSNKRNGKQKTKEVSQ